METEIHIPFLNRDGDFKPADWFHLVPKGTFPIRRKEGGKVVEYVQVIDDVAIQKMDAAFKNRVSATPAHRLLIDFEHFSHDTNKSSAAACWVNATEVRADGLWAKGEWSDEGEAAIRNRRYRYLSPVWFPTQTEPLGGNRFRPIEVNDAGLTNKPNLGDALQPFWNREIDFPNGREAITKTSTSNMKDRLILICGLAATATDEQIVAAVEGIKNRANQADTTKASLDTLTTEHTALKNRFDGMMTAAVDRTLTEYQGVITEEGKAAWKNRLTADYDGTVELLKAIKPAAAKTPVHNAGKAAAATAKKPVITTDDGTTPFLNRVGEVMVERKLDRADAIAVVAGEQPDLYSAYRDALTGQAAE